MKLMLNGVEYDDVAKRLQKVPVLYWLELEDQSGINTDALDSGQLSFRRMLAAYAYLIRRDAGESVTFKQAAVELVPEDALIREPSDDEDDSDDEGAEPGPKDPEAPSDD